MLTRPIIINTCEFVANKSQFVSLSLKAMEKYCQNFSLEKSRHWSQIYPVGYKRRKNDDDELDFLFLIGSQAFCFWGYPHKWTIHYKGKSLDGWWALVACFERAIEKGIPILEGQYLAKLSSIKVRELFSGVPEIPLIKERKKILKGIGKALVKKYKGRFHNFYRPEKREAFNLIEKISQEFSGFGDVATYKGKKVYFYKKAQVVISDICEIFKNKGYGRINNIDQLPGHADYKIPAILRKLGILIYHKDLVERIDSRIEVPVGSNMEIEIRANMLWATHLICEKLKPKFPEINPVTLDGILWALSQKKSKSGKPYHLTKTVCY